VTSVSALVLTRNRRELLDSCLGSLAAQTHPLAELIVLDNASSDGTEQWLAEISRTWRGLRVARREENLGGAGGYAELVRLGCETDADWLWLLDDDAEPRPDALERLLGSPPATEGDTAAVCSAVVHRDGTVDPQHRCRLGRFITPLPRSAYADRVYANVDCASFVGLLVRTSVARAAGLPRAEFFLGYDDAEYSLRLGQFGAIRLVPESVVTHKLPVGGGASTRRSRRWNRVLGVGYGSAPWETYWKDLYRVRNVVVLKREHEGISHLQLGTLMLGYVIKTLLYDSRPWRRMPWLIRFARRGWQGDFDAPSPEAWGAYARSGGGRP
jgi:rhamnopyranosyl-N-acetylglucosaminyl-diphospho-decaprenol beta-1,3/1,4-galactofuranosyltransferase